MKRSTRSPDRMFDVTPPPLKSLPLLHPLNTSMNTPPLNYFPHLHTPISPQQCVLNMLFDNSDNDDDNDLTFSFLPPFDNTHHPQETLFDMIIHHNGPSLTSALNDIISTMTIPFSPHTIMLRPQPSHHPSYATTPTSVNLFSLPSDPIILLTKTPTTTATHTTAPSTTASSGSSNTLIDYSYTPPPLLTTHTINIPPPCLNNDALCGFPHHIRLDPLIMDSPIYQPFPLPFSELTHNSYIFPYFVDHMHQLIAEYGASDKSMFIALIPHIYSEFGRFLRLDDGKIIELTDSRNYTVPISLSTYKLQIQCENSDTPNITKTMKKNLKTSLAEQKNNTNNASHTTCFEIPSTPLLVVRTPFTSYKNTPLDSPPPRPSVTISLLSAALNCQNYLAFDAILNKCQEIYGYTHPSVLYDTIECGEYQLFSLLTDNNRKLLQTFSMNNNTLVSNKYAHISFRTPSLIPLLPQNTTVFHTIIPHNPITHLNIFDLILSQLSSQPPSHIPLSYEQSFFRDVFLQLTRSLLHTPYHTTFAQHAHNLTTTATLATPIANKLRNRSLVETTITYNLSEETYNAVEYLYHHYPLIFPLHNIFHPQSIAYNASRAIAINMMDADRAIVQYRASLWRVYNPFFMSRYCAPVITKYSWLLAILSTPIYSDILDNISKLFDDEFLKVWNSITIQEFYAILIHQPIDYIGKWLYITEKYSPTLISTIFQQELTLYPNTPRTRLVGYNYQQNFNTLGTELAVILIYNFIIRTVETVLIHLCFAPHSGVNGSTITLEDVYDYNGTGETTHDHKKSIVFLQWTRASQKHRLYMDPSISTHISDMFSHKITENSAFNPLQDDCLMQNIQEIIYIWERLFFYTTVTPTTTKSSLPSLSPRQQLKSQIFTSPLLPIQLQSELMEIISSTTVHQISPNLVECPLAFHVDIRLWGNFSLALLTILSHSTNIIVKPPLPFHTIFPFSRPRLTATTTSDTNIISQPSSPRTLNQQLSSLLLTVFIKPPHFASIMLLILYACISCGVSQTNSGMIHIDSSQNELSWLFSNATHFSPIGHLSVSYLPLNLSLTEQDTMDHLLHDYIIIPMMLHHNPEFLIEPRGYVKLYGTQYLTTYFTSLSHYNSAYGITNCPRDYIGEQVKLFHLSSPQQYLSLIAPFQQAAIGKPDTIGRLPLNPFAVYGLFMSSRNDASGCKEYIGYFYQQCHSTFNSYSTFCTTDTHLQSIEPKESSNLIAYFLQSHHSTLQALPQSIIAQLLLSPPRLFGITTAPSLPPSPYPYQHKYTLHYPLAHAPNYLPPSFMLWSLKLGLLPPDAVGMWWSLDAFIEETIGPPMYPTMPMLKALSQYLLPHALYMIAMLLWDQRVNGIRVEEEYINGKCNNLCTKSGLTPRKMLPYYRIMAEFCLRIARDYKISGNSPPETHTTNVIIENNNDMGMIDGNVSSQQQFIQLTFSTPAPPSIHTITNTTTEYTRNITQHLSPGPLPPHFFPSYAIHHIPSNDPNADNIPNPYSIQIYPMKILTSFVDTKNRFVDISNVLNQPHNKVQFSFCNADNTAINPIFTRIDTFEKVYQFYYSIDSCIRAYFDSAEHLFYSQRKIK